MARRQFMVLRLPALFLPAALLALSLCFSGWYYLRSQPAEPTAAQIREQLREGIESIAGYYIRFKSTLFYDGINEAYRVDLWKSDSGLYRMEMVRLEGDAETAAQVVIFDGDSAYLYSPDLDDFYPIHEAEEHTLPSFILEDFWHSVADAESMVLLSEERGTRHSYYLVEIYPGDPDRHRVRELVWLEKESLLPVRLEVYDIYNSLTQVTSFEIIQLNPDLEAALFQLKPASPR